MNQTVEDRTHILKAYTAHLYQNGGERIFIGGSITPHIIDVMAEVINLVDDFTLEDVVLIAQTMESRVPSLPVYSPMAVAGYTPKQESEDEQTANGVPPSEYTPSEYTPEEMAKSGIIPPVPVNKVAKKMRAAGYPVSDSDINDISIDRVASIFNGTYTLLNTNTKTHKVLQIRTVTKNGDMKGKRIIYLKDKNAKYGWKGFAFLDGEMYSIWKKYRSEPIHDKILSCFVDLTLNPTTSKYLGSGMEMKASGSCIKCNRKLTDPISIQKGIGPHCDPDRNRAKSKVAKV